LKHEIEEEKVHGCSGNGAGMEEWSQALKALEAMEMKWR